MVWSCCAIVPESPFNEGAIRPLVLGDIVFHPVHELRRNAINLGPEFSHDGAHLPGDEVAFLMRADPVEQAVLQCLAEILVIVQPGQQRVDVGAAVGLLQLRFQLVDVTVDFVLLPVQRGNPPDAESGHCNQRGRQNIADEAQPPMTAMQRLLDDVPHDT